MQTAAIALIVVLLVGMACGLEITWALGLSCIVAVLLDPKLTFVVIAQRIFANSNSFSMLAIQTSRCICRFPRRLDLRWNLPGIHRCLHILCSNFRFLCCYNSGHRRTDVPGDGKARLSGILCGSRSGDRRNTWNRNSAEYRARYLR